MRHYFITTMLFLASLPLFAQEGKQALDSIQSELRTSSNQNNLEIAALDKKLNDLDARLKKATNAGDKVSALTERVQTLELKQKASEENTLSVYKANYQSALVNIISMDREIKPLVLFTASQKFFTELNTACNPTSYDGYQKWFEGYKTFIANKKSSNASLNVVSNLLTLTGDLTKGTPFSGPLVGTLFNSIGEYVSTIKAKNTVAVDEAHKMFSLTMTIGQFTSDKDLVEDEGEILTSELEELQKVHKTILQRSLDSVGIKYTIYETEYVKENDANKRLKFLNKVTELAAAKIDKLTASKSNEWKNSLFQEMQEIQATKVRFGTITFKIQENIKKYSTLLSKYQTDATLGGTVNGLKTKLTAMSAAFESTFQPLDYIKSASRMYAAL